MLLLAGFFLLGIAGLPLLSSEQRLVRASTPKERSAAVELSPTPSLGAPPRNGRATRLRGRIVENLSGRRLGRIVNFVVDLESGQMPYALVSSSRGFLGLGKRLHIVPMSAISLATAKRNVVALDVSLIRWKHAPQFNPSLLTALRNPAEVSRIHDFYSQTPNHQKTAKAPRTDTPLPSPPESNQNDTSSSEEAGALVLMTDIMGKQVLDSRQEKMGKVTDVWIDPRNQGSALAVISPGRALARTEKFGIPLQNLEATDSGQLITNTDDGVMADSPPVETKAWRPTDGQDVTKSFNAKAGRDD